MKNKNSALIIGMLPYIVGCIAVPVFFEYYFNWRELLSAQTILHSAQDVEIVFDVSNITFLGGLLPTLIIFLVGCVISFLLIKNIQKASETKAVAKPFLLFALATGVCVSAVYTVLFIARQMWLLQPIVIGCVTISCILCLAIIFKRKTITT